MPKIYLLARKNEVILDKDEYYKASIPHSNFGVRFSNNIPNSKWDRD